MFYEYIRKYVYGIGFAGKNLNTCEEEHIRGDLMLWNIAIWSNGIFSYSFQYTIMQ